MQYSLVSLNNLGEFPISLRNLANPSWWWVHLSLAGLSKKRTRIQCSVQNAYSYADTYTVNAEHSCAKIDLLTSISEKSLMPAKSVVNDFHVTKIWKFMFGHILAKNHFNAHFVRKNLIILLIDSSIKGEIEVYINYYKFIMNFHNNLWPEIYI